jgi:hypothetical protein
MTRWRASVLAILLPSFPSVANAQVDCHAVPAGPARTDCYIALSRAAIVDSRMLPPAMRACRRTRRVTSR